ncbi:MAG: YbaB/EbfC family nucleoid-associated protein [Holosporaceae bacterium]|jgi:DNA-binding YbaB/EbfC family protein|nr:YbaB/EbfC family nucleoid-associated protein [Holosporaceae bacterium]
MSNFDQLMKQIQEMQAKFKEAQGKVVELEASGSSGGGMVTLVLSGKGEIKKLHIDESLLGSENAEIVADLIIAAHNGAKANLEARIAEQMGGLLPPGMSLPF